MPGLGALTRFSTGGKSEAWRPWDGSSRTQVPFGFAQGWLSLGYQPGRNDKMVGWV
jgi:hypothetical protein